MASKEKPTKLLPSETPVPAPTVTDRVAAAGVAAWAAALATATRAWRGRKKGALREPALGLDQQGGVRLHAKSSGRSAVSSDV